VRVATRDEHAPGNPFTDYRPRPITMRRAQSVRNHANGRPSLQLGADDMGTLTEGDERSEDGLRKKLLEKDRENDKVCVFGVSSASLLRFLGVAKPSVV
jgi:hypothetical protein